MAAPPRRRPVRYVRFVSTNSLFQAHASPDAHYVVLPILENASVVKGWVVYDSTTGEIVRSETDSFWASMFEAQDYIEKNLYKEDRE